MKHIKYALGLVIALALGDEETIMKGLRKTLAMLMAVVVAMGASNADLAADTLFWDDFEYEPGEQFSDYWNTWSNDGSFFVGPVADPDPDYPGDQALLVDDYLTSGAGATSKQTFEYANQIRYFSADLKDGQAAFADQRYTHFSLVKTNGSSASYTILSVLTRPSNHSPTPNGIDCRLVYDDNGTEATESSGILFPSGFVGEEWHTATFAIGADGIVDFLIDDESVYTSTHPIIPDYSGQAAIELGLRKSYYDNVLVTPEPATITLLLFGGIMALKRRR